MNRESQVRFVAVLLFLLTVAAVVFAGFNFQSELRSAVPDDGVWWVEQGGRLTADRVDPNGPGARSGIKPGDQLISVNGQEVQNTSGLERQLYRNGVWSKAAYSLLRHSVLLDSSVILVPAERSLNNWLRLIALIYLGIGLYVLLRRWTAPGSTHFYIFCLVSFIAYSFKYTGKLNDFDWTIYWGNIAAGILQPALFLHFVLTFPEKREFVKRHPWMLSLVYVPGAVLLAIHLGAMHWLQASERLRWNLDRMEMSYGSLFFLAAATVLWYSYRRASTTILRQQLKWVTRGTILAVIPYSLLYVLPYLMGSLPDAAMKVSALSLALLPLTFGYAIFRYRLMDVDLIFKRGMAYTIAAGAITAAYFGAVGMASVLFHQNFPSIGPVGLMVAIAVTALLFDPFKNWVQEYLDKFFYRKRYDYRKTLIEFGRDLNSETDLDKMLSSIVDRLSRTLLVDRIAVFLADADQPEQFYLAKSYGIAETGVLDHGQPLIVVHGDDHVGAGEKLRGERGVRRHRPLHVETLGAQAAQHRLDHIDLLAAQVAGFSRVRIKAENCDPRRGEPEMALQVGAHDAYGGPQALLGDRPRHLYRKLKISRHGIAPALPRGYFVRTIKRRVNLRAMQDP